MGGAEVAAGTAGSFLALKVTGKVGLAVTPCAPAGSRAAETVTLGTWTKGHAWSTAKVPVAIASLKARYTPANKALTKKSIRYSDNEATSRQRASLGSWKQAVATLRSKVLKPNGVNRAIKSTSSPPNGFGMWVWSLEDQAVFGAGIAAKRGKQTTYVLAQMRHVTASQRWGLGKISGAAFKGGWGVEGNGRSLSRQFGVIRRSGGACWAVAIASDNAKGLYAANKDLTIMARWLNKHLGEFPAGSAPALPK
jgi:hypothetical protein